MTRNRRPSKHRSLSGSISKRRPRLDVEQMEPKVLLATFTVLNANASGADSLLDAINQSNLTTATQAAPNVIRFAIPGSGAQTISLTQQLPDITQPTSILGYTQAGSSRNTNPATQADNAVLTVVLNGASQVANGLIFDASAVGSRIEGLDLEGFNSGNALIIQADNVTVAGNFIGIGPDGTATANTINMVGVQLNGASNVTIGGLTNDARNVITGNLDGGIRIEILGAVNSSNNLIVGNFIGVGPSGTLASVPAVGLRNNGGVRVDNGASNTIGGTALGAGNVISGNATAGVIVSSTSTANNLVQGNIIGLDITATTPVPNPIGLELLGSTGNTVGGSVAGAGNIIAGSTGRGFLIAGNANSTTIAGNIIGTNAAGAPGLGNGSDGIAVFGSQNITIGGTVALAGNVISGNGGRGLNFQNSSNDLIEGNLIGPSTNLQTTLLPNVGGGVFANTSSGVTLQGNVISGNSVGGVTLTNSTSVVLNLDLIRGNVGYGVNLTNTPNSSIVNSTIGGLAAGQGNTLAGITIVNSPGVSVGGTVAGGGDFVQGNGVDGIDFDALSINGLIRETSVAQNGGIGIALNGTSASPLSGTVLIGDTVSGNLGGGVLVNFAGGTSISGSTIGGVTPGGNNMYGVSVVSSDAASITNSSLLGNTGDGLDVTSSTGVIATNNVIASNTGIGVLLTSSPGASLGNSTIGGSVAGAGNGLAGISVVGSSTAGLVNLLVQGNGGDGIDINATSPSTPINNSTISGNAGVGISLIGTSENLLNDEVLSLLTVQSNGKGGIQATFTSNLLIFSDVIGGVGLGNTQFGISLSNANGANVRDSTVSSSLGDSSGIVFTPGDGVKILNSSNVTLSTLSILANEGTGIAATNANNLRVIGDVVQANVSGILLTTSPNSSILSSTIGGTISQGNQGFGVSVNGSNNVTIGDPNNDTVINNNAGIGILVDDSTALSLYDLKVSANRQGGISLTNTTGTLVGSTIGGLIGSTPAGNGAFGVAVAGSQAFTIGGPGLNDDVYVSNNNGVGIALTGSTTPVLQKVHSTYNLTFGLEVTTTSGLLATESDFNLNKQGGALVTQSNSPTFRGDNFSANGDQAVIRPQDQILFGLSVASSPFFLLTGSMVRSNDGVGVVVTDSPGVVLTSNVVQSNGIGGISLTNAPNSLINNSQVGGLQGFGNGPVGISLISSPNTILGNIAGGNSLLVEGATSEGILVSQSSGVTIVGTFASFNRGAGIRLTAGSDNARLLNVLASENIGAGIIANSVKSATFSSLTVRGNSADGIDLVGSDGAKILDSTIVSNGGIGIMDNSAGLEVSGANSIQLNVGAGIEILGPLGHDALIQGASVTFNQGGGIFLSNTTNNQVGSRDSGNFIVGNGLGGIQVDGAASIGNVIANNLILVNVGNGLTITDGSSNVIGGPLASDGNAISGNFGSGVAVLGKLAVGNKIFSNKIGTNSAGTARMGNQFDGILIDGALATIVGGVDEGNVISTNGRNGVVVRNSGFPNPLAANTSIVGNFIGTDGLGAAELGNGNEGILVDHSTGTRIGSATTGGGNVVSANRGGGIELAFSSYTSLLNNRIGTDFLATRVIASAGGSQLYGVFVNNSNNNVIGGTFDGARNFIAGSNVATDFGIQLFGTFSTNNLIQGNSIGTQGVGNVALGDHIGILIEDAKNNVVSGNILAGGDEAQILIRGPQAIGNLITDQNVINGSLPLVSASVGRFPVGILIQGVAGTIVSNNIIINTTVGIEVTGRPTTLAAGGRNTTIEGNTFFADARGVFINGSPANKVSGNTFNFSFYAGVEVLGIASANNEVSANTFQNNTSAVYVENATLTAIVANTIIDGVPTLPTARPNPDATHGQTGIFINGASATSNVVAFNTVKDVDGYGVVFLDTPQGDGANFQSGNTITGSSVVNLQTDATKGPSPVSPVRPTPLPVPVPAAVTTGTLNLSARSALIRSLTILGKKTGR